MIDDQPDQADVESLIENATSENWNVTDWNLETGAYEKPEVTLTVEYGTTEDVLVESEADDTRSVKEVIREIEKSYEQGAPVSDVKTALYELEIDVDPTDKIESLRRKGEVYEPKDGRLRTT